MLHRIPIRFRAVPQRAGCAWDILRGMSGDRPEQSEHEFGLDAEQVRRIAELARLELTAECCDRYCDELGKVLAWASMLDSVDYGDLVPMAALADDETQRSARADEDEPGPMLEPGALDRLAPRMDGPFIEVPKVLAGGES